MKEITITARNSVGSLATVAEALGAVGVNIEAISAYAQDDSAMFRLLTNDAASAVKTLSRLPGVRIKEFDVLIIRMPNRPGELGKLTRRLANKGVNLESLYIVGKTTDITEVAIKPSNTDFGKAREVLGIR